MLKRFSTDVLADPIHNNPAHAFAGALPLVTDLQAAKQTSLFGLDLVNAARDETARSLALLARRGVRTTVQFINAHCVNVAQHDPAYRAALAGATYLLPDGSGMKLAAKLAGAELGENLNGTDLFPLLCREAAAHGQSVFLLGGQPGIAATAAANMVSTTPGLRIAGTRHGFWSAHEEASVIAEINASGATIVLIGMGVPVQELWIDRVRARLSAPVVMGVGGLFDYYSGAIARAPLALRAAGCEWLWRLALEPRRLFVRYVLGNPRFVMSALAHAWQARGLGERVSLAAKHLFDRAAASAALVLFAPMFLLIAVMIKLEDGGPVYFRQTRIGEGGKPFRMWKFRSMVTDAEARLAAIRAQSERDGTCFKMKHDPRITCVGAIIRRLSLDELPQLINIARGDMSVVGPRPALPCEVISYRPETRARLSGRPGLTCTWQVSGRADIPFEQQVELDVTYLQTRSMLADMWLILRTVPAVLTARGAY